ncbi:MAG TPA: response regulator [Candidatus Dormibacteraeota bacterium]|nr:response regulator [Candidatus Dormibacteraeota bacterium]
MALRINGEDRVVSQIQKVGGFRTPPVFDPHSPKRTRGDSTFSAGDPAPQAHSRRILFIEDDRFIADMYRMKLEAEGWNVDVVVDGEAGLRRALEDPPSLVLLDMLLPRMDGLEVLRRIRADERTRDVPVMILSNALGLSGREQDARGLGIVDWVVKANTTPAQLSTRVAKILAH